MLVKYWMNKDVITIDSETSIQNAVNLMSFHQVSLLPVLKKGRLVGVVTDRDLKRASASDANSLDMHELGHLMSQITVREIMSRNLITVSPDYTLEETAAQLVLNHISGAPVIDDQGELVGIISQREIFMALISLTGYGKKGLQLAFQVEDRAGSVKELTETIGDYGGRLVSLLTSTSRAPAGHRYVYVRIYDLDREKMPELLGKLTDKATLLYLVDHRENKREEYGKRSLYLNPKVTGARSNKEKHAGHQSVQGSDSPPSDENRVDCPW